MNNSFERNTIHLLSGHESHILRGLFLCGFSCLGPIDVNVLPSLLDLGRKISRSISAGREATRTI